ncbi:MAG: hypothetical protein FWC24_01780 [Treponema sp.]|nr:hypothetical protein [Treponema sp.]
MGSIISKVLLALVFFLYLPDIHAFDIEITGKEIEGFARGEYNRGFYYYGEISSTGVVEFNDRYAVKSGISLGKTAFDADVKAFASVRFSPLARKPLHLTAAYIFNGLPEYKAYAHTILPAVFYNARRAGIGVGTCFRFTSFFSEPALFEAVLSLSSYFNFINRESLRIGITCANFNDFTARNMGAYTYALNTAVRINKNWTVINDVELIQGGSVAMSAAFYGVAWKGGAKFTW